MSSTSSNHNLSAGDLAAYIQEKSDLNNSVLFTSTPKKQQTQQKIQDIFSQAKYCEEDVENLKKAKSDSLSYVDFSFDYSLKKFRKIDFLKKEGENLDGEDKSSFITWKRISEIYSPKNYQIFPSEENLEKKFEQPKNLKIKNIPGLKNLQIAFKIIKRCRSPEYLKRLIVNDPSGWNLSAYQIKLNIGGVWTEFIIDDYFPVSIEKKSKEVEFCFSEPLADSHEIWEMLIEKTFAKAYNGYEKLTQINIDQFLSNLTGAPVKKIKIFDLETLSYLDSKDINIAMLSSSGSNPKVGILEKLTEESSPVIKVINLHSESEEEILRISDIKNLEIYSFKLESDFSYNSVHVPLSSSNFIQAVVKIGIQESGSYTFQIHQKPKQLYSDESPFSYNKVSMTLAKLVEGGVEYVDHTKTSSDLVTILTLNNIEFEGNYVLLIDVESNKKNYIFENQYQGDLVHWRDIVLAVYGSEYCRLDSLALDPNRGMIYDFFLHRTWKHFSRIFDCTDFNKPLLKGDESEETLNREMEYVENFERRVWELDLGEPYGKIEIIRECFIMENLMFFKFINSGDFNIEIVDLLLHKLEPNLECFGPFEVNNVDPTLLVNSKSDDILLFKYNNKLKSIKNLKLKNSNFAVSPCQNSNPEEYYGQDPYDYMTKLYTVQPSKTYPLCTFAIGIEGYIVNNIENKICENLSQKNLQDSSRNLTKAGDLYQIGDSCDLFEVIEGQMFCKGGKREIECYSGKKEIESFSEGKITISEMIEVEQVENEHFYNKGGIPEEKSEHFLFGSILFEKEEKERSAVCPQKDEEVESVKAEEEEEREEIHRVEEICEKIVIDGKDEIRESLEEEMKSLEEEIESKIKFQGFEIEEEEEDKNEIQVIENFNLCELGAMIPMNQIPGKTDIMSFGNSKYFESKKILEKEEESQIEKKTGEKINESLNETDLEKMKETLIVNDEVIDKKSSEEKIIENIFEVKVESKKSDSEIQEKSEKEKVIHISSIELEPVENEQNSNTQERKISEISKQILSFGTSLVEEFDKTKFESKEKEEKKIEKDDSPKLEKSKPPQLKKELKQKKEPQRPKQTTKEMIEEFKKKLISKRKKPKPKSKSRSKSPKLNLKFKEDTSRSRNMSNSRSKSTRKNNRSKKLRGSYYKPNTSNFNAMKAKFNQERILKPWRINMTVKNKKPWKMDNFDFEKRKSKSKTQKSNRRVKSRIKNKRKNSSISRRKKRTNEKKLLSRDKKSVNKKKKNRAPSNSITKVKRKKSPLKSREKENRQTPQNKIVDKKKIPLMPIYQKRKRNEAKPRVSKKKVIEEILKENYERNQNFEKIGEKRGGSEFSINELDQTPKHMIKNVFQHKIEKLKKEFKNTFYKNKPVHSNSPKPKEKSKICTNNLYEKHQTISREEKLVNQEYGIRSIKKSMLRRSSRGYNTPVLTESNKDEKNRKVVEVRMEKIVIVGDVKKNQSKSLERKSVGGIVKIPAGDGFKRDAVSVDLKKRRREKKEKQLKAKKKVARKQKEVEIRPLSIANAIKYRGKDESDFN